MMVNILKQFFKILCRRLPIIVFLLVFLPTTDIKAQGDKKQPRILIVLDESSSMTLPWVSNKLRSTAAKELIMAIMDSVYAVNINVEFALRAFGEQHIVKENNCTDTKLEVMFSQKNKTQMALRLDDLQQLGVTPIAYSLQEAAENDMSDQMLYYYGLILITDGEESCNGNICDVVKNYLNKKINYKPYIINLTDNPGLKKIYDCMGSYLQTTAPADIPKAAGIIKEAFKPDLIKIVKKEKPVVVKEEPIKVNMPDVVIYKPERISLNTKLQELKRASLAEPEPDRLRVRATIPDVAIFKPVMGVSTKLEQLARVALSEPEPDRLRIKATNPELVIYKPAITTGDKLQQLKRIYPDELGKERIRLATPEVALYKPELYIQRAPMQMVSRIMPDEIERERTRHATPEVAIYKPDINIPVAPVQMMSRVMPDEVERERTRLTTPEVAIYKPGISIPVAPMQMISRVMPDEVERERTRLATPDVVIYKPIFTTTDRIKHLQRILPDDMERERTRLTTPEVSVYKPEINIPIAIQKMEPVAIAEMELDKLKFSIPDVSILQLPPFTPDKMKKAGRPTIDTMIEQVRLSAPFGVAVDDDGNMYITDNGNNRIRKVNTSGIISTVAGTGAGGFQKDGVPAVSTTIYKPRGILIDDDGNIIFSDRNNYRVRKIDPKGIISTIVGTGEQGFTDDSGVAAKMKLYLPSYLIKNDLGDIFLSDSGRLWKIDKSGNMAIIAGNGYAYTANEADANYVKIVGDRGPARKAYLFRPRGIAIDHEGNLYVADRGHFRIRKIDAEGIITTAVGTGEFGFQGDGARAKMAKLNELNGLLSANDGTLYFTDGHMVRRMNSDGRIYIVAGTGKMGYSGDGKAAVDATLANPVGLALDKQGNLYIAEAWNHVIRKVDTNGIITTAAGCGKEGFMGDGLPAASGAEGE